MSFGFSSPGGVGTDEVTPDELDTDRTYTFTAEQRIQKDEPAPFDLLRLIDGANNNNVRWVYESTGELSFAFKLVFASDLNDAGRAEVLAIDTFSPGPRFLNDVDMDGNSITDNSEPLTIYDATIPGIAVQIGDSANRQDVYASTLDADGGTLTDPAGVSHSGELADIADLGTRLNAEEFLIYSLTHISTLDTGNLAPGAFSTTGVDIGPDGDNMYVGDNSNENIREFTLSPAYDQTSASQTATLDVSGEVDSSSIGDIFINDAGDRLFVIEIESNAGNVNVYQYNLSTSFDLSTASYSGNSYQAEGDANLDTANALTFSDSGDKMFIGGLDTSTNPVIIEYSLGSSFDLSSTVTQNNSINPSELSGGVSGLDFGDGGNSMYASDRGTSDVHLFTISTAFDLGSTVTFEDESSNSSLTPEGNINSGLTVENSGRDLYTTDGVGANVIRSAPGLFSSGLTATGDIVDDQGNVIFDYGENEIENVIVDALSNFSDGDTFASYPISLGADTDVDASDTGVQTGGQVNYRNPRI